LNFPNQQPSKVLIALVTICVAWICVISLAVVTFLGTAVSIGWIVGGTLAMVMVVGGAVAHKEVGRATELPDYIEECSPDAADRFSFSRRDLRNIETFANRAVVGSRDFAIDSFDRTRTRRVPKRADRPRVATRT
jgi:hypothetical protein